ncbi:MAG: hypothetical protein WBY44_26135 [Bryobacteraceae bacterium]
MGSPLSILDYRQPLEFKLGDVIVRSWIILARHLLAFLGLVAILEAIPLIGLPKLAPLLARPGGIMANLLVSTVGGFVAMMFSALSQAVVVYATFQDLRGREVNPVESFSRGLGRVVPAIATSILEALAVAIGLVLFLAPGLIALAAFSVALPICVVERAGPLRSLSRSAELTRGYWWPILGVALAIIIVSAVVGLAIRAALPASGLPATIAAWAWNVFVTAYSSVYAANLYHDLRAVKEGIGIQEIASVFD